MTKIRVDIPTILVSDEDSETCVYIDKGDDERFYLTDEDIGLDEGYESLDEAIKKAKELIEKHTMVGE